MSHRLPPPIWVINLRRSVERREMIREQLDRLGLDYELVEGVDGRELSPEDLALSYDRSGAIEILGTELTKGEIGCGLSHINLYRRQLEEGHQEVMILEDDVVIDPSFVDILHRRDRLPRDWELVLFHQLNNPVISSRGSRMLDERYRCVSFDKYAQGTQSYLIRLSGARKLLKRGFPVRVPADCLTGGYLRTGVRVYGLDPPCIRERTSGPAYSTMPENYALHAKRKEPVEPSRLDRVLDDARRLFANLWPSTSS